MASVYSLRDDIGFVERAVLPFVIVGV